MNERPRRVNVLWTFKRVNRKAGGRAKLFISFLFLSTHKGKVSDSIIFGVKLKLPLFPKFFSSHFCYSLTYYKGKVSDSIIFGVLLKGVN